MKTEKDEPYMGEFEIGIMDNLDEEQMKELVMGMVYPHPMSKRELTNIFNVCIKIGLFQRQKGIQEDEDPNNENQKKWYVTSVGSAYIIDRTRWVKFLI